MMAEPVALPAGVDRRTRQPDRRIVGRRITDLARHDQELVTIQQIAEFYQCDERKIRHFIATGDLPAKLVSPRMIRVRTADLRAFHAGRPAAFHGT